MLYFVKYQIFLYFKKDYARLKINFIFSFFEYEVKTDLKIDKLSAIFYFIY